MADCDDNNLLCRVFFGQHEDEDVREMFDKSQRPIGITSSAVVPVVPDVNDFGDDCGGDIYDDCGGGDAVVRDVNDYGDYGGDRDDCGGGGGGSGSGNIYDDSGGGDAVVMASLTFGNSDNVVDIGDTAPSEHAQATRGVRGGDQTERAAMETSVPVSSSCRQNLLNNVFWTALQHGGGVFECIEQPCILMDAPDFCRYSYVISEFPSTLSLESGSNTIPSDANVVLTEVVHSCTGVEGIEDFRQYRCSCKDFKAQMHQRDSLCTVGEKPTGNETLQFGTPRPGYSFWLQSEGTNVEQLMCLLHKHRPRQ